MAVVRQLRVAFGGTRTDLEVVLPDDATVADLVDVLDAETADLMVAGRIVQPWMTLDQAGVRDGVVIDLDQIVRSGTLDDAVIGLDQLAGSSGPVSLGLAPGTHNVGGDAAGPDLGATRFRLSVTENGVVTVIPDGGPLVLDDVLLRAPTMVGDQVLNAGGSRFRLGPPPVAVELPPTPVIVDDSAGRVPPNRGVVPGALPAPSHEGRTPRWLFLVPLSIALGVLGLIAHPAFFAGAAVVLLAAAALLLIDRRDRIAERSARHERTAAVISTFDQAVVRERRTTAEALRVVHPSIPELQRRANTGSLAPFEVADVGQVLVGWGDRPWRVSIDSDFQLPGPLQDIVDRNDRITSVPVCVDLTAGPVGIVGPRDRARTLARSILLSACARWAPEELGVAIAVGESQLENWEWLKWTPQFDGHRWLATTLDAVDPMVDGWRRAGGPSFVMAVVDEPKWASSGASLLGSIGSTPGLEGMLVLGEERSDLPPCASTLVLESDGTMTIERPDGSTERFVSPSHATVIAADDIARGLAWTVGRARPTFDAPGASGVRPFRIEAASEPLRDPRPSTDAPPADDAPSVDAAPHGVDTGPASETVPPPVPPREAESSPAPQARPTVIRAAATDERHDAAALVPPTVPPPPPTGDPGGDGASVDEDDVIDLRDRPADAERVTATIADPAGDDPGPTGTRWTRRQR